MSDQPTGIGPLQLSPLAQWVALRGPKSPVLDVSTPPGLVCRTIVEAGRDLVCVSPHSAVAEALSDQFESHVEVKAGQITNLPLASHSIGSVVAVNPDLEGAPVDAALDEFVRVLEDGGLLVVAPEPSPDMEPWRRTRELRDLQEAVLRRLDHGALIGLSHRIVATLGSLVPGTINLTTTEARDAGAGPGSAGGMVMVASNRPLPPMEDSFVAMSPPEVDQWLGDWHRMLRDLRSSEARAEIASRKAEGRNLLLEELLNAEQRLFEASDEAFTVQGGESLPRLQEANQRIRLLNDRIALLEEAVDAANARIQDLQQSTSWRLTEPLRRLGDGVSRHTRR
jgi:SAM-dependent methyltransferase